MKNVVAHQDDKRMKSLNFSIPLHTKRRLEIFAKEQGFDSVEKAVEAVLSQSFSKFFGEPPSSFFVR